MQQLNGINLLGTVSWDPSDPNGALGWQIKEEVAIVQVLNSRQALISSRGTTSLSVASEALAVPVQYPFRWPWDILHEGDSVTVQQNVSGTILGVILAVVGTWVALILLEQAVFEWKRKGESTRHRRDAIIWLLITSLELSVCSFWAFSFASHSSVAFQPSLSISMSFWYGVLALFPDFALITFAFWILLWEISRTTTTTEVMKHEKSVLKSRTVNDSASREEAGFMSGPTNVQLKESIVPLSATDMFLRYRRHLTWHVLLAAALVTAAIIINRIICLESIVVTATVMQNSVAMTLTAILDYALMVMALLVYSHGIQYRFVGSLLFSSALVIDYQVNSSFALWTYEMSPSRNASLDRWTMDSVVVNIIVSVIAGLICLAFMGLQFNRMKLSRNTLALSLAQKDRELLLSNQRVVQASRHITAWRNVSDYLTQALEIINTSRPIHREYAVQSAMQATASKNVKWMTLPGAGSAATQEADLLTQNSETSETSDASVQPVTPAIPVSAPDAEGNAAVLIQPKSSYTRSMPNPKISRLGSGIMDTTGHSTPASLDETNQRESVEQTSQAVSASGLEFSLTSFLAHPVCVELLKDEMIQQHCVENLLFYLDTVRYRGTESKKFRKALAKQIFQFFIAPNSREAVNISDQQRHAIEIGVPKAQVNLFDDAGREALRLIESNMMTKFKKTPAYKICTGLLKQRKRLDAMVMVEANTKGAELLEEDNRDATVNTLMSSSPDVLPGSVYRTNVKRFGDSPDDAHMRGNTETSELHTTDHIV